MIIVDTILTKQGKANSGFPLLQVSQPKKEKISDETATGCH